MRIRRLPMLLIMAATLSACGREASQSSIVLEGIVTQVTDGETIKVQLKSGPVIVHLDSIDAPERDQPYGQVAAVALSELVARGQIELEVTTRGRYDRLVAVVHSGGINVNETMVRNGHAWADRPQLKDVEYCVWESEARERKKGLWRLPPDQRVAPWEWRGIKRGDMSVATDYTNETVDNCVAAVGQQRSPSRGSISVWTRHAAVNPTAPRVAPRSRRPATCRVHGRRRPRHRRSGRQSTVRDH